MNKETIEADTKKYLETWGHLPFWADTNENFNKRVRAEEIRRGVRDETNNN